MCDGGAKVSVACPGRGGEVGGGPTRCPQVALSGRRLRSRWGDEMSPRWEEELYKPQACGESVVFGLHIVYSSYCTNNKLLCKCFIGINYFSMIELHLKLMFIVHQVHV